MEYWNSGNTGVDFLGLALSSGDIENYGGLLIQKVA
jgi:hypothetical protein